MWFEGEQDWSVLAEHLWPNGLPGGGRGAHRHLLMCSAKDPTWNHKPRGAVLEKRTVQEPQGQSDLIAIRQLGTVNCDENCINMYCIGLETFLKNLNSSK